MFDPDLLAENAIAREGIKLLANSGILEEQLKRIQEQLALGDADEADEAILTRIRKFRRAYGIIATLQELGGKYNSKETEL